MSGAPTRDRQAERHQATVDEILEAAWRLARERGLAGLSLRALGDEVGMRPQSLYTYFDSKHAIYDAMFAQGYRQYSEEHSRLELTGDARADFTAIGRSMMEFSTADPVRYQLLFQRTIPGFEPSAESYAIAVEALETTRAHLVSLGFDDPADLDLFTALGTGLTDQQISNDPGGDRWARLLDDAVEMYLDFVTKRAQSRSTTHRKERS